MKNIIIRLILLCTLIQCQAWVFAQTQNVGIGLLSPAAKLHIKGSADITQLIIAAHTTQSNTNPLIRLRDWTGSDLMWIHSDNTSNTFVGFNTGRVNSFPGGGSGNTFMGGDAGRSNTEGTYNLASGYRSLYQNVTGDENTASGHDAMFSNTEGSDNTAIGTYALWYNVAGSRATAIGAYAMRHTNSTTSAYTNNNVAVGYEALRGYPTPSTNTGLSNTAVGYQSLKDNTTGSGNTTNGYQTLFYNSTGNYNTSNGYWALYDNTTGSYNTALGTSALQYNLSGAQNTATGYRALWHNTTGSNNIANGYGALYNNTSAGENTAIGVSALYTQSYSSGAGWNSRNVAIGTAALFANQPISTSTGINNTAIGNYALNVNVTGSKNTALGCLADVISTNLTNATAIGYNAKVDTSNALVLGGTGVDAVRVGIAIQKPHATLDVNGDVVFRTADITIDQSINLALDVNTNKFSSYRISIGGAEDIYSVGGITAGTDGRLLTFFNSNSDNTVKFKNEDPAAISSNRIITGSNEIFILKSLGMVSLQYDTSVQRWIIKSSNSAAGESSWDNSGENIFFDNFVGIGTEDPDAPLTIQTGLDEAGLSHKTDASSTVITSSITNVGGSIGTSSDDIFSLNAGGEGKVHVWPDGRVVIGDDADPLNLLGSNPVRTVPVEAKLTIETPINSTGWLHIGGSDSIIVQEAIGGISAAIGTLSNHAFRLNANGLGRLHLLPDGNIVVGNNVQGPQGRFTVYTGNNTNGISQMGGDGQLLAMRIGGSSASIGTMTPHIMRIVANGVGVINIDPAGNIGIGTPDPLPGYKMAVNGNMKARELVIETVGWPDYVFANDYRSLSLPEVEQFIKQHHHLPNIPSAKELEEGGVAVGEMQKKMMEKIEELTLYIIELNKEIQLLKESNK